MRRRLDAQRPFNESRGPHGCPQHHPDISDISQASAGLGISFAYDKLRAGFNYGGSDMKPTVIKGSRLLPFLFDNRYKTNLDRWGVSW